MALAGRDLDGSKEAVRMAIRKHGSNRGVLTPVHTEINRCERIPHPKAGLYFDRETVDSHNLLISCVTPAAHLDHDHFRADIAAINCKSMPVRGLSYEWYSARHETCKPEFVQEE